MHFQNTLQVVKSVEIKSKLFHMLKQSNTKANNPELGVLKEQFYIWGIETKLKAVFIPIRPKGVREILK